MVQGGYVSPSSAKTLTVNKKSNVLNKIPPRGPRNATNNSNSTNNNNNNNNDSSEVTSSIDVSPNKTSFSVRMNVENLINAIVGIFVDI